MAARKTAQDAAPAADGGVADQPAMTQVDGVDVSGDGPVSETIAAEETGGFGTWVSPDGERQVTAYNAVEAVRYRYDGWTRK